MSDGSPRRLIEIDLPIRAISAHARREKSIRHGHISTLHIWWARRPLASCRAVICASLWPDPAEKQVSLSYRTGVVAILEEFATQAARDKGTLELLEHFAPEWKASSKAREKKGQLSPSVIRDLMLAFIADFASFDASCNASFLKAGRTITQLAHKEVGTHGSFPTVLDPFAGGGTIPLEAKRIGSATISADLNPVASLLQRATLEIIPRRGEQLRTDLSKAATEIRDVVERKIATLYASPDSTPGYKPYAWFWARSIPCPGPGCGILIPVVRQFWIAKKGNKVAIRYTKNGPGKPITFEVFTPRNASEVPSGTTRRGKVTCPACGFTTKQAQVESICGSHGISEQLIAVAEADARNGQKRYRSATTADFKRATTVTARSELDVPTEAFPYLRSIFNPHVYGFRTWSSLLNNRQLAVTMHLLAAVRDLDLAKLLDKPDRQRLTDVRVMLGLLFDRQLTFMTSFARWAPKGQHPVPPFSNNGFPMVWDYVEINPFAGASGSWDGCLDWIDRFIVHVLASKIEADAVVELRDARESIAAPGSVDLVFTDPPYYDAVPYANLSEFFYIWLRKALAKDAPSLVALDRVPMAPEIVQLAGRNPEYAHKTRSYFEQEMGTAFSAMRQMVSEAGLACFVFAHKSTEAWEALLQSVIDARWQVVASWPIDTERASRVRANNSAALGSSIHLVCRPRRSKDVGQWAHVREALPLRMKEWLPRLQAEGVVGADAVFSCLGPALEIYSQYEVVEKVNGERVALGEFLEHVWAEVAREALSMLFKEADASGMEPDARVAAMWLWTLSAETGVAEAESGSDEDDDAEEDDDDDDDDEAGETRKSSVSYVLEYDAARKIAQGLGARLEDLGTLVEVRRNRARLRSVSERAATLFTTSSEQTATQKSKKKQTAIFEDDDGDDERLLAFENPRAVATTLDRVHQAMLLFASGRADALKRFLNEQGGGAGSRFWKLAQVMGVLYPRGSEERRWVDGVLVRRKGVSA